MKYYRQCSQHARYRSGSTSAGFRQMGWLLLALAIGLGPVSAQSGVLVADGVLQVGTIDHFAIDEGSGLASSRQYPGVVWTHNDGGAQFLFALTETGDYLGGYQVVGANLIDWEAVAADNLGNLYLADIGSNGLARTHVAVHRVREPNPSRPYGNAEVTRTWYLRFPVLRVDCESFFVLDGYGYLISKPRDLDDRVTMFRYPLSSTANSTLLEEVTKFEVTASVNDATVSTDGNRLGVLTDQGAYVYYIAGNPAVVNSVAREFTPFLNEFMEGATFVDEGLLVSAETRELFLFTNLTIRTKRDLRITEVMPGAAVSPGVPTSDWWELTSFEAQPVDLTGWRFNDSVGELTDPYTFSNGPIIAPGESIIFTEELTADEFRFWWGPENLPPGLRIFPYSGAGLSFRLAGDTLSLWDDTSTVAADTVSRAEFGAAELGVTFNYDPITQQFGARSVLGVNGVIRAASASDIGSPGRIVAPPPTPRLNVVPGTTPQHIRIEFDATAGFVYSLEASENLEGGSWSPTGDVVTAPASMVLSFEKETTGVAQFYRVRATQSASAK
ncbi:MAG TPA: lamin tail domain-containing protein [Verrucomicrobiae bacterium]|nr:lamin tail domain-containing protein [Verrucomicrobiae bacterium]